jgi:hypothetical protein
MLKNVLVETMEEKTGQEERFLEHYDLNDCDDGLIFQEWIWQSHIALTSECYRQNVMPAWQEPEQGKKVLSHE